MYRNNQTKGFKPILASRQAINNKSLECSENIDKLSEKSECGKRRSTSSILNLFKKPSENSTEKIEINDSRTANVDNTINIQRDSSIESDSDKIIYNIVIGKQSARKHKKWDDDGTLEVTGKRGILKDSEGNIIHRANVNPDALVEGFRMHIASKEIEIIDRVTCNETLENKSSKETVEEPPAKKRKLLSSGPCLPLTSSKKGSRRMK